MEEQRMYKRKLQSQEIKEVRMPSVDIHPPIDGLGEKEQKTWKDLHKLLWRLEQSKMSQYQEKILSKIEDYLSKFSPDRAVSPEETEKIFVPFLNRIKEWENRLRSEGRKPPDTHDLRTKILDASKGQLLTCEAYAVDPFISECIDRKDRVFKTEHIPLDRIVTIVENGECKQLSLSEILASKEESMTIKDISEKLIEYPHAWTERRIAAHEEIIRAQMEGIKKTSDAILEREGEKAEVPLGIYIVRGNTASGKTRLIQETPILCDVISQDASDENRGIINPDNFKISLLKAAKREHAPPSLNTQQTHHESSALSRMLLKELNRTIQESLSGEDQEKNKIRIVVDQRFGTLEDINKKFVQEIIKDVSVQRQEGVLHEIDQKKDISLHIQDIDIDFIDSAIGVLGRTPESLDPRVPLDPIFTGFIQAQSIRRTRIISAILNGELPAESYILYRRETTPQQRIPIAEITEKNGVRQLCIQEENLSKFFQSLGIPGEYFQELRTLVNTAMQTNTEFLMNSEEFQQIKKRAEEIHKKLGEPAYSTYTLDSTSVKKFKEYCDKKGIAAQNNTTLEEFLASLLSEHSLTLA